MNYGYVKDGQVLRMEMPSTWVDPAGNTVVGMQLLPEDDLNERGWFKIFHDYPVYDPSVEYITAQAPSFDGALIRVGYDVYPKPADVVDLEQLLKPSAEEVAKAEREVEIINLLIELEVIV